MSNYEKKLNEFFVKGSTLQKDIQKNLMELKYEKNTTR